MICARCGQAHVEVGATCHLCGAVAVAPDVLDSVLSLPAEPVPELLDDEPTTFQPLMVDPGTAATVLDDPAVAGPAFPAAGDARPAHGEVPLPAEPVSPPPVASAPAPAPAPASAAPAAPDGPPLPRRTPIDATAPRWGPREHPPAVLAPPPPHPLDAPPPRVKRPQGTGLPPGLAGAAPAPPLPPRPLTPSAPPAPPRGPAEPIVVPDRPSHPRVRRWFGRGGEPEEAVPEPVAEPVEVVADGPFAGAPAGLLDGVRPEPDIGAGVRDPAGLEAAMGRLSAGARRSALAPLAVVAALLEPGEVAEAVVQGEYQHRPGVVVLTDRRVVVANDRRWKPDVRTFAFDPRLVVHGWQDERRATLVFVLDGVGVEVDAISDRPLARDLAQRIRGRCAGEPPMGC